MTYVKRAQNMPKKKYCNYGSAITRCICCNTSRAIIRRFKINTCRRCMRENYRDFGLVKY